MTCLSGRVRSSDEQAALEWLDNCANPDKPTVRITNIETHARTLKAMLSRPTLPEEPTGIAKMVIASYGANTNNAFDWMEAAYHALYAHLTAPKTKEVEVWHAQFAVRNIVTGEWSPSIRQFGSEAEAHRTMEQWRDEGATTECISITGPHKQTVPL